MLYIDLSYPIKANDEKEVISPKVNYIDHKRGADLLGLSYIMTGKNLTEKFKRFVSAFFLGKLVDHSDFHDEHGLAWEELTISSHNGTHMDAPYHYGKKNKISGYPFTIDQIPLNWCFSNGVLLDFKDKSAFETITAIDIKNKLLAIGYAIQKDDIVLIRTIMDYDVKQPGYVNECVGLSTDALDYLIDEGVNIIGTDGWGIDRPLDHMIENFFDTKDSSHLWPAHLHGRKRPYFHIEKLTNLDKISAPYNFSVICLPVKIENGSAGWCRVVAVMK